MSADYRAPSAATTSLGGTVVAAREATDAKIAGVYLVDPATHRLALRAWATEDQSGLDERGAPSLLGQTGIGGDDLSVETLRDFIHTAPDGERLALPIHEGSSWIGAIVGVSDVPFSDRAHELLHQVAAEIASTVKEADGAKGDDRLGRARIGQTYVAEPEESVELPSEGIYGHTASEGVTFGSAMIYQTHSERMNVADKVEESRQEALRRFDGAMDQTRVELERLLADRNSELYDVVSLVFATHVLMLNDETFSGSMRSLVEAGQTPEDAVQAVVASFVRTFRDIREARLAEKAQDVQDIGQRLLASLGRQSDDGQEFAHRVVIVRDALPSDLVRLAMGHASGVVMFGATVTAHISILAQSLGLPMMMTDDKRVLEIVPRTRLLLDAAEGVLYVSPGRDRLSSYGLTTATADSTMEQSLPDETERRTNHAMADGQPVSILVNVNLLNDALRGRRAGADGIGLYRSEFPFIIRNDYVSEDEQYGIYRAIVESMPGSPVVLRTADIGGDKLMAGREEERNPFLGVRGIRFSLANRDLFRAQLRAMLRAGEGADLHIMFPMVSTVDEIEEAIEEVRRCSTDLERRGVPHHRSPKMGAMVELPSAVVAIEEFAESTDFLSIGTNDLIMYLLAVDRTNERLSELYRSHHPVVLRTIADVARRVGDKIDELSVCGESASDPLMVPFFLGIGIRKLSVAPTRVNSVADVVASYDQSRAAAFSTEIQGIRALKEMDEFLKNYRPPRMGA